MKKLFLLSALCMACNNSPLLNQAKAQQAGNGAHQKTASAKSCENELEGEHVLCFAVAYDLVQKEDFGFEIVFWDKETGSEKGPYIVPKESMEKNNVVYEFGIEPIMNMGKMFHGTKNDSEITMTVVTTSTYFGKAKNVIRVENIDFVMGGQWDIHILYGTKTQDSSFPKAYAWQAYSDSSFSVKVPW